MDYTYISNEGSALFLYRYGSKLQFASPASCSLFLRAVNGGLASLVDAIVKDNIFEDEALAHITIATKIVEEYFGQQSAFYMIGTADDFLAIEHGASNLADALPALAEYIDAVLGFAPLEKTLESASIASPAHTERTERMFKDLRLISEDPVKRSDWLKEHAAVRARRDTKGPLPIAGNDRPMGSIMWSMSTFNATGMQKLTYQGQLPITMTDDYTIVQQPEPSFTIGSQALAWYSNVPWFAYGGNSHSMVWKTITGRSFGISIVVPMVYFSVGSDPYYEVWRDDFEHWYQPPGGPSAPYTFPQGSGYTVQIVPTCGGKILTVQMHIEVDKGDLAQAIEQ